MFVSTIVGLLDVKSKAPIDLHGCIDDAGFSHMRSLCVKLDDTQQVFLYNGTPLLQIVDVTP